jgi:hypothetical protein
VTLYAPIDGLNLKGNLTFRQPSKDSPVTISVYLSLARIGKQTQDDVKLEWSVFTKRKTHKKGHLIAFETPFAPLSITFSPFSLPVRRQISANPVQFGSSSSSCSRNELGRVEHELWKTHGELVVSGNSTGADSVTVIEHVNHEISLQGMKTIWGRSIVLRLPGKAERETCSNLLDVGDVHSAHAQFIGDVSGEMHFRQNEREETLVYANLFYVGEDYRSSSKHDWRLLVTDLYDRNSSRSCHYLTTLLDPFDTIDIDCSADDHRKCKVGDLARKHGQLTIGAQNNR